jgi:hypothetical protein
MRLASRKTLTKTIKLAAFEGLDLKDKRIPKAELCFALTQDSLTWIFDNFIGGLNEMPKASFVLLALSALS